MPTDLGFEVTLSQPFERALDTTRAALKDQGFGVVSEVDMRNAFREKLGLEFRPYVILGACNPPLAHRAITAHPEVGLLLPCNVTVEDAGAGRTTVRLVDPDVMLAGMAPDARPVLREIATDARARLERVTAALRKLAAA
jgi:uncharacterized protein (DUF302 family)